jgi:uncharacterized iron-regulated membrane protein
MTFRKTLFWLHLSAGVISGLSIAIMCFTGTVLAFEKELTAWYERDARRVDVPPPGTTRLSLDDLQRRLRTAHPDARPTSIILQNDPAAAVAFSSGRTGGFYVNPYTGDVRQPESAAMGRFMQAMVEWHRYLGFTGDVSRPRGKWINGVCNLAFCLLAVSGLYLWMPRTWSWRSLRPIVWFRQNSTTKARDFNWHNAIGFWTAPVLIVLTLTAVPISFRWGGTLISKLTGTPTPSTPAAGAGGARPGNARAAAGAPHTTAAAQPLALDPLFAAARQSVPDWKTITLRTTGGPGAPGGRAQAVTLSVREQASWPRTATTTLTMSPDTATVLSRTGYRELEAAQQVRAWTRFLHTGEALGWLGQLVAGIACLGGVFLVYTGFALSWRRFFGKRTPDSGTLMTSEPVNSAETARIER